MKALIHEPMWSSMMEKWKNVEEYMMQKHQKQKWHLKNI
jgi:hypothetical protein